MALSHRGQNLANDSDDLLIWKVIKDLWDPKDNPDGFVSLGVAENALMHEELTKYINENVRISTHGLTYGDGGTGSKQLRAIIARFLTRKLRPVVPIEPSHICITNGVSCGIEHLSNIFTNPGDAFLLGQPHYGAFIDDIELRTGAKVVKVAFGDTDPLSLPAVAAYEAAIESCAARKQKVAGLMLCNPHNPLGRCYPRDYIIELMKLCQKHQIHLVSDEIYAFSVFKSAEEDPSAVPFTSLSSIPTEGIIDPSLTHILWGLSKDFGANGLRLGCIVSQHNTEVHKALVPLSIYSYASSLTESITTTLLSDDKYVDWYIVENNRKLKTNYEYVETWAKSHGIEYVKGVNAAFFIWVQLGSIYEASARAGMVQKSDADKDIDKSTNTALLSKKIFLAAGTVFGSEKPGWFRIVFSQNKRNLEEGLRRIERALGLTDSRAETHLPAKL